MNKKILQLALPNIVSNITIPLLGLVDMALMGHLGSKSYIGAIALGGIIFNFIYWSFSFLRMGTSGFTAQAFGEKNESKAITLLARALIVALTAAVLIISLKGPIEWISFKLIHGSHQVEQLAAEYFRIRIWAAPATISIFALSGWFLGMQNAKIPMLISILINVANIGFNCFFIFGLGMNSNGVALGTVLAQYIGLLFSLFLLNKHYRPLFKLIRKKALLEIDSMLLFFKVNRDIFLRTLCLITVFTFFTSRSAATNDTILAVNSLLLQFLLFYSYFIDGFAFAAEALTGRYIGANKPNQLRKVVRRLFLWGVLLALVYSLIYLFGNKFILQLLTNNADILKAADPFMFWVVLIPAVGTASFLWDGIFIGATASKGMLYSMLGATLLVFFPLYFGLQNRIGNHALWLAMIAFMGSRGLLQTFMAEQAIFRRKT